MSLMNEYVKKRLSGAQLEHELNSLVKKYKKHAGRPLFIYAAAMSKGIPGISLSMDDYYAIFDHLRNITSNEIDFYVETPGGSGEAAEEIARFLRSKFDTVNFVISGEAKSAGTILVMSGDDILMTASGSLGPIDAQMKIGRSVISAYDYQEWVKDKMDEAARVGRLNPFDATMVAQISPGEIRLVHHSLNMAKELVENWLAEHKFKNWNKTETKNHLVTEEMKKERAKEIADQLINHGKWRSHGRSIKIDDLRSLGLRITGLDDDPKLSDIVYRIQVIVRLLFDSTDIYKMFFSENGKMFRRAVSSGSVIKNAIPQKLTSADINVKCEKCGKNHKLYVKFQNDANIDKNQKKKGLRPFPKNNRLKCKCGFEQDLLGIRNNIEAKMGHKIIT